jgi:DNA-binding MarR family transcriptional regulator
MIELQILKRVERAPHSQLELAKQLEQQPAGVCRTVAELERKKLVRCRRDPDDSRRVLVEATAKGAELVRRMRPLLSEAFADVLSPLHAADRATLIQLLEKIVSREETAWPSTRAGSVSENSRGTSRAQRARRGRSRGSSSFKKPGASTITSRT